MYHIFFLVFCLDAIAKAKPEGIILLSFLLSYVCNVNAQISSIADFVICNENL